MNPQVDRVPLEAVLGWDATLNGNLAEQLQEPSLMGAYEGAGITVLARALRYPRTVLLRSGRRVPGRFPASPECQGRARRDWGSHSGVDRLLHHDHESRVTSELKPNPYPSNFECNPSSIDGLTIRDSSRAAAASTCTAGTITCKLPTIGSTTTRVRSPAASRSARVSSRIQSQ